VLGSQPSVPVVVALTDDNPLCALFRQIASPDMMTAQESDNCSALLDDRRDKGLKGFVASSESDARKRTIAKKVLRRRNDTRGGHLEHTFGFP
jgi:hypothetical protein